MLRVVLPIKWKAAEQYLEVELAGITWDRVEEMGSYIFVE
jgi:hypothetical protein